MVNNMLGIGAARNRIKDIITDRIYQYYPELSRENLYVKDGIVLKRQHKSIIYQFDVYNNGLAIKHLIVKKRILHQAYNNNVELDTNKEFHNLRLLYELLKRNFNIPRALDAIPQEGILITEKVKGRDLYSYLRETAFLPLKSKKEFLEKACFEFGRWLKEFHNMTSNGGKRAIDAEEYIVRAKSIKNKLISYGISEDLLNLLIEKMRAIKHEVVKNSYPVASKHGDFQPRNIIWYKNAITVLDMSSSNKDVIFNDICHFLAHLYLFNLKHPIFSLSNGLLDRLGGKFLEGYFEKDETEHSVIDFIMCFKLISLFEFTYRRNSSFLKRMRIVSFYKKRIRQFVESSNKGELKQCSEIS